MRLRSKNELKKLVSFRAVLWMLGCVVVLLMLSAIIQNLALVNAVVFGSWSFGGSLGIFAGLLRFDTLLVMTGILMGANIFLRQKSAVCGVASLGAECASCGMGILSVMGFTGLFPFGGVEFGIVSVVLLGSMLVFKK